MNRLGIAAVLMLAAGCGEDETIRVYTAPKEPTWRMIAALVPAGDATWFFKLVASGSRAGEHKGEVERFLATLKVDGNEIRWTLPESWRESPGQGDRVATLTVGKSEPPLEISVTRLAGSAGGPLANINRWRNQLGLGPLAEADLATQSRPVSGQGLLVDFEGPRKPSMAPMAGGGAAPPHPTPSPQEGPSLADVRALLDFTAPSGWVENPRPGPPRLLEFRAGGEGAPVVSMSYLEGNGGGLGPNVNRWRGQLGLVPLDDAGVAAAAGMFDFLGSEGRYVDLAGSEKAMLVVFRLGPPFSLFLKMDGSREAVGREKPAFEAFARSVRVAR